MHVGLENRPVEQVTEISSQSITALECSVNLFKTFFDDFVYINKELTLPTLSIRLQHFLSTVTVIVQKAFGIAYAQSVRNSLSEEQLTKSPIADDMLSNPGSQLIDNHLLQFFKLMDKKNYKFDVIEDFFVGKRSLSELPTPSVRLAEIIEDSNAAEYRMKFLRFRFIPYVYQKPDHITLFFIDYQKKFVGFYNSKPMPDEAKQQLSFKHEIEAIRKVCFGEDEDSTTDYNDKTHQGDIHNCGVHVMNVVERLLQGYSFNEIKLMNISTKEIEILRANYAAEMIIEQLEEQNTHIADDERIIAVDDFTDDLAQEVNSVECGG